MSLLLNMLSRLVIMFLPRSKRLLISWLQSSSTVILEPHKIKSDTVSTIKLREQYTDFYFACNPHRCTDSLIISVIHQIFFFLTKFDPTLTHHYYLKFTVKDLFLVSYILSVQFSSVAQSCLTLCDPMNCSTPGLPVPHQLPKFTQTHFH